MYNYIKVFEDGSQVATRYEPVFGSNNTRTEAGYNPDVYVDGQWYNSTNGTELITNGTFDSDTTGWTGVNNTLSSINGNLNAVYTSSGSYVYTTITTTAGVEYRFEVDVNGATGDFLMIIDGTDPADSTKRIALPLSTSGKNTIDFVAQSTSTTIRFDVPNSQTIKMDNVTVYETNIEPDTLYTTPFTYLPIRANVDEQGNVVDIDAYDMPTLVEDYVKADKVEAEMLGKNSCTAWVNFDGTTTPPTIRDSYNVDKVIRTATGIYDIYFKESMDNTNYSISLSSSVTVSWGDRSDAVRHTENTTKKFRVQHIENGGAVNPPYYAIQVFGGKN